MEQTLVDMTQVLNRTNRRSGHISVVYKNCMIVWGGYMNNGLRSPTFQIDSVSHPTDELWVYNCSTEVWQRILTRGEIPPKNSGSCGVLLEDFLYVFGGYVGFNGLETVASNSNQLYRLDFGTLTWEHLHPSGDQPAPCDKLVGWSYCGKLYFFGGFGPVPEFGAPFQYLVDITTEPSGWPRGWNNQLVVYNPVSNSWEWPRVCGPTPSPRAAHAADISGHKVFLFGGRSGNMRQNDLHCLDMAKMQWSGNLTRPFELSPEGRSWHSFTFVTDTRAIVYGGFSQYNTVLSDCWFLDVTPTIRWCRFHCHDCKPRLWHRAQYVAGELLVVGGHRGNILDPVGRRIDCGAAGALFCRVKCPQCEADTSPPSDDCWLLTVHSEGLDHEWQEFVLPYDHGEPRCSHTARFLPAAGELLIHSGSTQPFYETRPVLREHAEELLVINFTPKSLLRLCLDAALSHEQQLKHWWSLLPRVLQTILEDRLQQV